MYPFQSVECDASIISAMQVLENAPTKLLLVLDKDGRLNRTVTDGDLRRALLAGRDVDTPIGELEGVSPTVCRADNAPAQMLQIMDSAGVQAVVIVDAENKPLRIVQRSDLDPMLLLSPPHIGSDELSYVNKAFEENWIAPAGPNLVQFENELTRVSGRGHALAVTSGTAAIHLALRVLGVAAGDRIYVSNLTFVASLQPILYENAEPVLIDSEPVTWNMSPSALQRQLERDCRNGTLPKAVVVVHIYGQSADMNAIMDLCNSYGVPVVEDAAESLGATYDGRPSGSHGVLSAYSFNGNKIITTSGGGALVSDDGDLVDRARMLSTQGRDQAEHYQHSQVAYNYRLSNILAGVGLGQLSVLPDRVAQRRKIFDAYRSGLSNIGGISFQEETPGSQGNRWLTVITLDPDVLSLHPYQVMRRLAHKGIESRPAWKPMHMQPLCRQYEYAPHTEETEVSSVHFLQSLCLPSGSAMTESDTSRVVDAIRAITEKG